MTRLGPVALAAVASLALAPTPARPDCAMSGWYRIDQRGTTVRICPSMLEAQGQTCADRGLLRLSASGEAVLLTACDGDSCFVDECVPAGTYEYGFATPYGCWYSCTPNEYYATAVVPAAAGECQRTVPAPAAYTGAVPWRFGADPAIPCPGGRGHRDVKAVGCGSTGAAGVFSFNAALLVVGALLWRARTRRGAGRA